MSKLSPKALRRLTVKQHRFILAYRETSNVCGAFRASRDTSKMSVATIKKEAQNVFKHPSVAARLADLALEDRARCAVTVDSLTEKLWDDRKLAHAGGNPMAAVNATMAVAKLHGLADGQGAQSQDAAGTSRPPVNLYHTPSKWSAMLAEIEAEAARKKAEAEPEVGNGADGNTPASDTRH